MKNKTTIIIFITLSVFFYQLSFARGWTDFVKDKGMKPGDSDRISEIYDSKKKPFIDLVKEWEKKEVQEKQIQEYEKYGIDKNLATKAINERLKLSQKLIESNFWPMNDVSPTLDILDNRVATMNHIAVLGHERFKKLAEKYEMGIDDGFYQCLCRSKGIMGSGLGYSPEPDKHCDNSDPCKGGNWGCASSDFPKQGESWMACSKRFPLKNGENIFQVFDEHVNTSDKFDQDQLARKLFDRTLKFRESCLPSMDSKNIEDIQNIFKTAVTRKAIDISESSESMCEEAIAVSLYLNSEKRTSNSEAALEGLMIWALPTNTADISDISIKISPIEGQLTKFAGKYLPIVSKLMNIKSTKDLITRVYNEDKIDAQYKEAFKLFEDSKKMNEESLDNYVQILNKKIQTLKEQVISSDERYSVQLKYAAIRLKEKIEINQNSPGIKLNQSSIDVLWNAFEAEQQAKKEEYEERKAEMLGQYTELMLYRNVISEYRKPLNEKGCDEFIKDRIKHCGETRISQG